MSGQENMFMTMRRENFLLALCRAIESTRAFERNILGYTMDSGLLKGWVLIADHLLVGGNVEIKT